MTRISPETLEDLRRSNPAVATFCDNFTPVVRSDAPTGESGAPANAVISIREWKLKKENN